MTYIKFKVMNMNIFECLKREGVTDEKELLKESIGQYLNLSDKEQVESVLDGDEIVLPFDSFTIKYEYPISNPITIRHNAESENGFTTTRVKHLY